MARITGSRNADYAKRRAALAAAVAGVVLSPEGTGASLRELAARARTSVSNLRHYFGDRDGAVAAALEWYRLQAAPHLAEASVPVPGDVRASLERLVGGLREAWFRHGVGKSQAASLSVGLSGPALGQAYVNAVLEPLLQAGEGILQRHVELGDLAPTNVRYAALELLSPVFLGLLHQDALEGARCRPLDIDDFVARHLDAFLAAYPPRAAAPRVTSGSAPTGRPKGSPAGGPGGRARIGER